MQRLHFGLVSSHLTRRCLQVRQPVLVLGVQALILGLVGLEGGGFNRQDVTASGGIVGIV